MQDYQRKKDDILHTMQRVSLYLSQIKAENHVICYIKEQVLKSLEKDTSVAYGMYTMHQVIQEIMPDMTVEYHAKRFVRPPIQRVSMASIPMDRSWARPVRNATDGLRQFGVRILHVFQKKQPAMAYSITKP